MSLLDSTIITVPDEKEISMAHIVVEQQVDLYKILLGTFRKNTFQSLAQIHSDLRGKSVHYSNEELGSVLTDLMRNWTTLDHQQYRLDIQVVQDCLCFRLTAKGILLQQKSSACQEEAAIQD